MDKQMKEKKKQKITDWIQAIASAISIPAAIIACFVFFQKDLVLQSQINKLDTIANQSLEHTRLLTEQVTILKNELNIQIQQNELSQSNRKSEIAPKLIIEFDYYNGDVVSAKLINNGKSARILKKVDNQTSDFNFDLSFQIIGEGKEKEIFFKNKRAEEGLINKEISFKLFYEDIDKKKYSKEFKYVDIEGIINDKHKNDIQMN